MATRPYSRQSLIGQLNAIADAEAGRVRPRGKPAGRRLERMVMRSEAEDRRVRRREWIGGAVIAAMLTLGFGMILGALLW